VGRECGCVKNPIKIGEITDLFVELCVIVFSLRRGLNVRRVVLDVCSCRHCRLAFLWNKRVSARVSRARGAIGIILKYIRYS
jgi:hypothetical protein